MAERQWERVKAGDVQVGDEVARTRNSDYPPLKVKEIRRGARAVRLIGEGGGNVIRPRLDANLWKVVA
jgi:hypothetical protein